MKKLCIDVGGTFTDCLVLDESGELHKFKAPTTPDDPTVGFFDAVGKAGRRDGQTVEEFLAGVEMIVHGTTLGTNTLITGRGARVGMITTKGFRDLVEIRRGIKNLHGGMFNLFVPPYQPLVPRSLRLGVEERTLYTGEVRTALNTDEVRTAARQLVAGGCQAIVIGFLHSYINREHERQAKALVQDLAPGVYVTTSSEILPVWREFERFSTSIVSAYIGPEVARYLRKLETGLRQRAFSGSLLIMLANGLVQVVENCVDRAIYTLGSGPAAAPYGGRYLAGLHARRNLLSVDMGGTSFDICMVRDGEVPTTTDGWVGEERVAIKMVDVSSVGAGGGSIAWIDSLGLLRVGPQSAGADPGPAAYGRGESATVTDADLVLGYIPADYFLGGEIKLDVERSRRAIDAVGQSLGMDVETAALAIFTTINSVMAHGIGEVCTKKGHDVRDFVMVAGGGAGGVHAAGIAKLLSIPEVIVPRVAALMSAFGMFTMDIGQEYVRSKFRNRDQLDAGQLRALYEEMRQEAVASFALIGVPEGDLRYQRTIEMRYVGQFHDVEIDVPPGDIQSELIDQLVQRFHQRYKQIYTYSMLWLPVEFLTFRLRVTAPRRPVELPQASACGSDVEAARRGRRRCRFDAGPIEAPVYDWERLSPGHRIVGAAVVDDPTTSVLVPPGFDCTVDAYRNLVLRPVVAGNGQRATN